MIKKYNYSILKYTTFITILLISKNTLLADDIKSEVYKKCQEEAEKMKEVVNHISCDSECPGYFSEQKSLRKSCCLAKCKIIHQSQRLKRVIKKKIESLTK